MTTFNKNCVINVIKYNISIELSRILSYTIWCNFLIGNVLSWECRLTLLPRTIIVTQITKLRTKTVGDILLSKDTFQNLEFWHVFFMKQVLGGSWHDITWKKKAFKELVFSKQLFQIWLPDVEVLNLKMFRSLDVLDKLQGLWVNQNSDVLYVLASRITFICAMSFEAFPLDIQTCLFQVIHCPTQFVNF